MNTNSAVISRRNFIIGAAAAGGGLSVGFHVPLGAQTLASATMPEVNAWVVVRPDESCVIRIARAEMGQGTHTGLAQLVAEELECDWNKVVLQPITAGQNLARKRVWRDMSTGGSRGIRGSQEYVRQGGAAARMVLLQAAANLWQVPVAELRVDKGVVQHAARLVPRRRRQRQRCSPASHLPRGQTMRQAWPRALASGVVTYCRSSLQRAQWRRL